MLFLLSWLACDNTTGEPSDTSPLSEDSGLADEDGDGWDSSWDCDDQDPEINPDAVELCDGLDNNCDGQVDEGVLLEFFVDADLDGHGDPELPLWACALEEGLSELSDDCDDDQSLANPGLSEICNDHIDNDCDGTSNECAPSGAVPLSEALFGLTSDDENDLLGWEMRGCADMDGDGLGELLVGSIYGGRGDAPTHSGAAYLVRGQHEGVADIAEQASVVLTSQLELDALGSAMAGGADLTGDGQLDWAVAAPGDISRHTGLTLQDAGEVMIYSGDLQGTWDARQAAVAHITGANNNAHAGFSLAMSSNQLLVGAHHDSTSTTYGGAVYLLSGPLQGETSLDQAQTVLLGDAQYGQLGVSVALTDLDGDGVPELMAAAPGQFWAGNPEAEAHPGYLAWLYNPSSGTLPVSDADGLLTGEGGDKLGYAFSTGDVNGDGYQDLAVGAYQANDGMGTVYLFAGPIPADLSTESAIATVQGEAAGEQTGSSLDISEDLDGDGKADMLLGSWGWPEGEGIGKGYLLPGPLEGELLPSDARASWGDSEGLSAAGFPIHFLPDLTGDGIPEIGFGASYYSQITPYGGSAWIFQGSGL